MGGGSWFRLSTVALKFGRPIVLKRASLTVVLTVAAAIGLTACAQKTETVSTAPPPPPPPPMMAPPPPPEPYVTPPPPRRVVVHRRHHVRHMRRHRRHHH